MPGKTYKTNVMQPLQLPYTKSQPGTVPFRDAQKTTPDKFQNAWSVVGLSLASGFVAWIAGMFLILGLFAFDIRISAAAAGLPAGLIMLLVLIGGLWFLTKNIDLVTTIETITGHDLNNDGWVGTPHSTEITVQGERPGDFKKWQFPFPAAVLLEWAEAALNSDSLAYSSWNDRFALRPDKRDGEQNYRAFRRMLTKAGLARENHTHGIDLTRKGSDLLQMMVYDSIDEVTPLLQTYQEPRP